jgi:hypothetical protein
MVRSGSRPTATIMSLPYLEDRRRDRSLEPVGKKSWPFALGLMAVCHPCTFSSLTQKNADDLIATSIHVAVIWHRQSVPLVTAACISLMIRVM